MILVVVDEDSQGRFQGLVYSLSGRLSADGMP